jgi:hypothetical protein
VVRSRGAVFYVLTYIYRRAAAAEAQLIGNLRNKSKAA